MPTMVTVAGTVLNPSGVPLAGKRLNFRLLDAVRDPAGNVLYAARQWTAVLDAAGLIKNADGTALELVRDDNQTGYEVTEQWRGGESYTTSLAGLSGTVDYLDLPRAVTPAPPVSLVATEQALQDEIARAEGAEALLAPLDSPALTGVPTVNGIPVYGVIDGGDALATATLTVDGGAAA